MTLSLGRGQKTKVLEKIRWNLRKEAEVRPPFDECPTFNHQHIMNIIIWNSRGVLKPNFKTHIRELVQNHDLAIFVVMETKLGVDRIMEITDRLPFEGTIHTDTIGYVGGPWLLWSSDKVEIELLAKTKQEIHVESRYFPLTFLGSFLLYMLVLGVRRNAFFGKTKKKLQSYIIRPGFWLGTLMSH